MTTEPDHSRPFKPGWIDRLHNWVERLPVHPLGFYTGLGLGLVLLHLIFLWLDGGLRSSELIPVILFNGLVVPFTIALLHLLDRQAVSALDSLRPVLDASKEEYFQFRFRLAHMPPRPVWTAGLLLVLFSVAMETFWIVPDRYTPLTELPLFSVIFQIVDKASAFLFGAFFYHTIRQLRLVQTINASHVRVNLYNLGPLQVFARLTSTTAVGLVAGVYGWMVINPELLRDPVTIGFLALVTLLATTVFIWPLYGAHQLMVDAKEGALREIDRDIDTAFTRFNQGFRAEDYAALERLNGIITSLDIQRKRVNAIPTWPWKPETARFALTAIALPFIFSILRLLVERAFN